MEKQNLFISKLRQTVQNFSVLNHPFYQTWNRGELAQEDLRQYAKEYFPHVNAFPQYLSSLHAICPTFQERQMLLDHLIEEEKGTENHPELWCRFAEALEVNREQMSSLPFSDGSKKLVNTFRELSSDDYATGLGAIYAYESQVPEVAEVKIDGLKKFYGINNQRALAFFTVHREADVIHRQQFEEVIENLTEEQKARALKGAEIGAKAVWDFLSSLPISQQHSCISDKSTPQILN